MSRPKEKIYLAHSGEVKDDVLIADVPDEEKTLPKITCPTCGEEFEGAYALRAHRRVHDAKISCVICGESVSYIAKHLRTAHGVQVKRRRDAVVWMETHGHKVIPRMASSAKKADKPQSTPGLAEAIELLDKTIDGLVQLRHDLGGVRALQEENDELRARLELIQEAMKV